MTGAKGTGVFAPWPKHHSPASELASRPARASWGTTAPSAAGSSWWFPGPPLWLRVVALLSQVHDSVCDWGAGALGSAGLGALSRPCCACGSFRTTGPFCVLFTVI